MQQELVTRVDKAPGIAILSLNDPLTRNSMTEAMGRQFADQINKLKSQSEIRLVILTGAGEAFSAGGNLEMLLEKTKISVEENKQQMQKFYSQFLSICDLSMPVIAAINGHAVGAGLCLALACDLRIVKDSAKLGFNFVHLGLHPGMGATYFLPQIVGPARAAELLYTGKIFTAEFAHNIGLVNQVASGDNFASVVEDMSITIAKASPQAVKELKQSLRNNTNLSLSECLQREAQYQAGDYLGMEFFEGITAACEKRKPNF